MFPLPKFRILYPVFNDVADDVITTLAELGECYLSQCNDICSDQAWMLVVAHMLTLRARENDGESQSGAITSASILGVSVSFAAPPAGTADDHWFNLTPYGQQFLALMAKCKSAASAPFYVGNMPERAAFRSVGGRFPRGGRSW